MRRAVSLFLTLVSIYSSKSDERGSIVPDGVLTVLTGYGHTTGRTMCANPLVTKVDITVSLPDYSYLIHSE